MTRIARTNLATVAAVAVVSLIGSGYAGTADVPDPAAAAKGEIIYQRYCGSCHGPEGRGDGAIAADLSVPPTDLTRLAHRNRGRFPFAAVVRSIDGRQRIRGHGTPDMPVWAEIFPKTEGTESPSVESAVGRIAHYLWSVQAPSE